MGSDARPLCGVRAPSRNRFSRARARHGAPAFSLIEVIAAVAIFAFGIVAVLGLFAPVTKSIAGVSESESAARVADAVRARLKAIPFTEALALLQDASAVTRRDGTPNYNPNSGTQNPQVIFGKLTGDLGIYVTGEGRNAWYDSAIPPARVADADKYFEIDLMRNATLSPAADDPTATVVAYTMRVRWPMFVPSSSGAPVQVGANPTGSGQVPFDHSKKQVLFFNGTITR